MLLDDGLQCVAVDVEIQVPLCDRHRDFVSSLNERRELVDEFAGERMNRELLGEPVIVALLPEQIVVVGVVVVTVGVGFTVMVRVAGVVQPFAGVPVTV